MKFFATLFLSLSVLLFLACKNQSTSADQPVATTLDTDISQIETTRTGMNQIRTDMVKLNAQLNALPESIKEDTASGYSALLANLQLLDTKTSAMLTAYDQIIPELRDLQVKAGRNQINADSAKYRYDQLALRFDQHDKGLKMMQKFLKDMQDETTALVAKAKN